MSRQKYLLSTTIMANQLSLILSIFILFAGFIVGHGAVTVIDLLGFLGRKSPYWTETTIRAHKVTKPLIWIGTIGVIIGASLLYSIMGWPEYIYFQIAIAIVMILNGIFLSFYISPRLLRLESEGKSKELLTPSMQIKIVVSFVISFVCWWGNVLLFSYYLSTHLS